MEVERSDGSAERTVITGMIVDAAVLGKIAQRWDPENCQSKWGALIGDWCVDFYRSYGRAPGKAITSLFQAWAEDSNDPETTKLIEKFLRSLSDDYKQLKHDSNSQFVIDIAGKHFTKIKAKKTIEIAEGHLAAGNTEKALKAMAGTGKVDLGVGSFIDVLRDEAAMRQAFESKSEPLITFPGAYGEFMSDAIERDSFIVLQGPEKRGKTFELIDLAWRAMVQGRKVAFFEIGDLSQNQIMRRFAVRAARRPLKPCVINYPKEIEREQDDEIPSIKFETREFLEPLDVDYALEKCREVIEKNGSKESLLRLMCTPTSTLTIHQMKALIQTELQAGWGPPDLIIIDYMDILAPPYNVIDTQEQLNHNWMQTRAISQIYHAAVIGATQSNAKSYGAKVMTKDHFSRDKRKHAHVTGMIGLNQTIEEKELGLIRKNWIVLREGEFSETKVVHIAGCLGIANPAICSTW